MTHPSDGQSFLCIDIDIVHFDKLLGFKTFGCSVLILNKKYLIFFHVEISEFMHD